MQHIFTVTGMTCGHCEKAVTQAVKAVDPQARVVIDRSHDQVSVESTQSPQALVHAIQEAGYQVVPST